MLQISKQFGGKSVWSPEAVIGVWGELSAMPRYDGSYLIRCPYPDHYDANPSASLAPGKKEGDGAVFYCYVCGSGGGVPQLIEAIEELGEGEGYSRMMLLEAQGKPVQAAKNFKCVDQPPPQPLRPAKLVWLDGRGSMVNQPEDERKAGENWLVDVAGSYGLDAGDIECLGWEVHAVFRDLEYYTRLRLPSFNSSGNLVSWVEWVSDKEMKAFGMDRRRKFAYRRPPPVIGLNGLSDVDVVVLCEGETDALQAMGSVRDEGGWAVVSSPGAKRMGDTTEQIVECIEGDLPVLVVVGDGDDRGDEGAVEAMEIWRDCGAAVGQVRPPDGMDLRDLLLDDEQGALEQLRLAAQEAVSN